MIRFKFVGLEEQVNSRTADLSETNKKLKEEINERYRAEEALRESEEKYRQLFDNERDAIMVFDAETLLFEEANRACLELYGYAKDEFFRLTPNDISAQHEETGKALKDILYEEGPERIPLRYQKKKDGTVFPVEIIRGTFEIKGRKKIIGAVRDISERIEAEAGREKLQARLQQAQKLESIGTLAGGIAHDFNNILTPIMIHTDMVMEALLSDSPLQNNLKQIFQAGERARDLVKQILTFSRQRQQGRIALKLSLIVKEIIKFFRSTFPSTIEIYQDIQTESDTVLADPTQVNQILMNLCTNASHAMRETGGELTVRLIHEQLDSETAGKFSDFKPGSYLRLTVSDTGHGMDTETVNRIFEPYFTTKAPGEGTGMGLSIVHGIVKSYGGDITVESEPGKGTTFDILLSKIEADVSSVEEHMVEIPKGTENIFFVDDEKPAIDAVQPMLGNLGYKVTARTSGIDALEAFRNSPEAFDLVITDMTMPNMTGKNLAKELMSIRPDIPIILCTGFSEQIDERRAREMGISAFVMKPIVMREIANTIREVLDEN